MVVEFARWALKKTARRSVASLTALTTRVLPGRKVDELRAITYHRFGDEWPRDPFCVSSGQFEAQMRWLATNGLAVSLDDVTGFVSGKSDAVQGGILVTIDDGYRSVLDVALPILQEYGIPAVLFVSTGLVGDPEASAAQPEPYLDWDEVERLHGGAVTIGSHSHLHRSLGQLPPDEARSELLSSYRILQERLGEAPSSFAYPFGTPAHYNDDTRRAILDTGYATGFISTHGSIPRGVDPAELPRVKIEGGEGLRMFRRCCTGGMDTWRYIDHAICAARGERTYEAT